MFCKIILKVYLCKGQWADLCVTAELNFELGESSVAVNVTQLLIHGIIKQLLYFPWFLFSDIWVSMQMTYTHAVIVG